MLGFAAYARVHFGYFEQIINLNTIYITVVVGVALIFVAALGCFASQKGHKCLLFVYLVIVFSALIAQIASAILVGQYLGKINDVPNTGYITDVFSIQVNNGILSTFTACCTGCPDSPVDTTVCQVGMTAPYYSRPLANCNSTLGQPACKYVRKCDVGYSNSSCFAGTVTQVPPLNPDGAFCATFAAFSVNNRTIVGPYSTGSCGGGSPSAYMSTVVSYINSQYRYIIIAFSVLCGLQALNFLASFYLVCFLGGVK